MKFLKNRIIQITVVLILLIGIGFIINYNTKPVVASDDVGRGEYLTKIEEIETKLKTFETKITALEKENSQLKINLEGANKKISALENNQDLLKLSGKVDKIESWQNKLHELFTQTPAPMSMNYIRWQELDNFKKAQ